MEKPTKPKAKNPAKSLLKGASFSLPARPAKPSTGRGFSGPISIVPAEARHRRPPHSDSIDLDAILPRSPEVSCLGRVRNRKAMGRSFSDKLRAPSPPREKKEKGKGKGKGRASVLGRLLSMKGSRKETKEKLVEEEAEAAAAAAPGPRLAELRRFSSSRGTLAGFDWRAHVGASVEPVGGAGGDGEEEKDGGEAK